ncbi:MAG: FliO/MopB family protein [bacterium]
MKKMAIVIGALLFFLCTHSSFSMNRDRLTMIKEKTDEALSHSLFDNVSESNTTGSSMTDSYENSQDSSGIEESMKVEESILSKALHSVLILASVLAFAILCLYVCKCFIFGKHSLSSSEKLMKRKDTLYLAPKKSLSLIEVGGQWLLIGITPTSVTTLAQMEAPPTENEEETSASRDDNGKKKNVNFNYILKNLQNNLTSLKKV